MKSPEDWAAKWCTCAEDYTKRLRNDPQCAWHAIGEDIVAEARKEALIDSDARINELLANRAALESVHNSEIAGYARLLDSKDARIFKLEKALREITVCEGPMMLDLYSVHRVAEVQRWKLEVKGLLEMHRQDQAKLDADVWCQHELMKYRCVCGHDIYDHEMHCCDTDYSQCLYGEHDRTKKRCDCEKFRCQSANADKPKT